MANKQTLKRWFVPLLVLCLLVSVVFGGRQILSAYAAETAYTNVMDDLQKDEMFSLADYPDNAEDYSIQVEQIAESVNNELFIYTYQPSQKTKFLTATDINMSLSNSADGTQLYDLVLLSSEGVFCKYKVKDFVVKSEDAVRYYNISAIYRAWDESIDDETGNDNTKDGVAFSVGKLCYSLVYPPINIVCEVRTHKPIKNGVTAHTLIIYYVVVISDFFKYRYFVFVCWLD